jgi:hypothetical protein
VQVKKRIFTLVELAAAFNSTLASAVGNRPSGYEMSTMAVQPKRKKANHR